MAQFEKPDIRFIMQVQVHWYKFNYLSSFVQALH